MPFATRSFLGGEPPYRDVVREVFCNLAKPKELKQDFEIEYRQLVKSLFLI